VALARTETPSNNIEPKEKSDTSDAECVAIQQHKEQATPTSLTNYYLVTSVETKLSRLVSFLTSHKEEKCIVFFLTCACVEYYGLALQYVLPKQYYTEMLHGKLVQKRREKAMERFRNCGGSESNDIGGALLCTDVASRGLDVTDVQWVVQFDAPSDPAAYIHRVGRSARAGRMGSSLIFLTEKEDSYVDFLRMRKVPINMLPTSEVCAPPLEDDASDTEEKANKTNKDENRVRIIRSASNPDILITDILPQIRKFILKDRDLLEKGTKAFTSYIRAYKEHHCAFIFR
jgi:ATP-dependent RNA helicase DDX55/SPB4